MNKRNTNYDRYTHHPLSRTCVYTYTYALTKYIAIGDRDPSPIQPYTYLQIVMWYHDKFKETCACT